jgi:hypothetical protein
MNIDMSKTLADLSLQISDFIEVEYDVVKQVAAGTNGQFLVDRTSMPVSEFLAKYFAGYEVANTIEKMEAHRKAAAPVAKKAKAKGTILDQYGNYIVAIWENGDEFSASYRKTTHIDAHWDVLTKHEIEYKKDGRRFSVVHHTSSRKDAIAKKNALIEEMVARGRIYKGELSV